MAQTQICTENIGENHLLIKSAGFYVKVCANYEDNQSSDTV